MSWRKGLRWDSKRGGWVSIATGRLLTAKGIQRRKAQAKKLAKKPAKKSKTKPKPRSKVGKVYQSIDQMLERAKDKLSDEFTVDVRTHKNRDGTVDSELRIKPRHGQSVDDIFLAMEEAAKQVPGTWQSTGIRYQPGEDEDLKLYIRHKGMYQANVNYQRTGQMSETFKTGRKLDGWMQDKRRRKPEQVILRVHWNKENEKPDQDRGK